MLPYMCGICKIKLYFAELKLLFPLSEYYAAGVMSKYLCYKPKCVMVFVQEKVCSSVICNSLQIQISNNVGSVSMARSCA